MAKPNYVYAQWHLDRKQNPVDVIIQLRDECPISWGFDDDDQQEGFSLEEGILSFDFTKENRLLVTFEARWPGRVPKDYWLSPCQLADYNSHNWGIKKGRLL